MLSPSSLQFSGNPSQIVAHITDKKFYDSHAQRIILDERNQITVTGILQSASPNPYYMGLWVYSYYTTNIVTLFWINTVDGDRNHKWWVTLVPSNGGFVAYSVCANETSTYVGKYSSVITESIGRWQYLGFYFDRQTYGYTLADIFSMEYFPSSTNSQTSIIFNSMVTDMTYASIWSTSTLGYLLDATWTPKNQFVGLIKLIEAYDSIPLLTAPNIALYENSYDILWDLMINSYSVDSELKVKWTVWSTQSTIDNYLKSDSENPPPVVTNKGWMSVSDSGQLQTDGFYGKEVNHLTFELEMFIYVQYFDILFTIREKKESGTKLEFEIAHWFVSLKNPWIQFTCQAVAYEWALHFFTIVPYGSTKYEIWYIKKKLVKDTDPVDVWRSWSVVSLSSKLDYDLYKVEIDNAGYILTRMTYFKYALVRNFINIITSYRTTTQFHIFHIRS